jgi:hypothetical protein
MDVEQVEAALAMERDHAESAAANHLKKCNERLSKATMRSANLVIVALTNRHKKKSSFRRAMIRYSREIDRERRFEARKAPPHPNGFPRHDGTMIDEDLIEWIAAREAEFSSWDVEAPR